MRIIALITILSVSPALAQEVTTFSTTDFSGVDIVIIGEIHDDPSHHQAQADIVAALDPAAIVFEMLTEDQAQRVTDNNRNADLAAVLEWGASGWPDFAIYAPIFEASGRAAIVGAAPADASEMQARDDIVAAFGDAAGRFGLDDALPETEQAEREQGMQDGHCGALPVEMLPWFVDQQRFRDAVFASKALDAFNKHGDPIVVITGNGHARTDWGMPVYLRAAAPDVTVFSIGQITESNDGPPYDIWRISAPIARPDPCAAFQ
jgi:hypothetical protein